MSEGNVVLTVQRRINASAERLFDAWTRPELMKKWFHVGADWTTPVAEVDLKVGGLWKLQMTQPDGVSYPSFGRYQVIDRPNKLVFTWHPLAKDDYETTVTLLFKKISEDVTEIILINEGLKNEEDAGYYKPGWTGCLECLNSLANVLPLVEN
jgi:uncharacterized protein YndB with AHSA1/START domain